MFASGVARDATRVTRTEGHQQGIDRGEQDSQSQPAEEEEEGSKHLGRKHGIRRRDPLMWSQIWHLL